MSKSKSKSFQVPADITVAPLAGSAPDARPEVYSFLKFARHIWLDDPRAFTSQGQMSVLRMRQWHAVIDRFEASKVGDWITLDEGDYAALKVIVEAPMRSFPSAHAMIACLPFSDAVLDAVDTIPAAPAG